MTPFMMNENGNGANKKPITDFTILQILKNDQKENGDLQIRNKNTNTHPHHHPHPPTLNKVLQNPWIPLKSHSFNPSMHQRKLNFNSQFPLPNSSFFNYSLPILHPTVAPINDQYIENLQKPAATATTQHHTSIHNHFYSIATNGLNVTSQHVKNTIVNTNHNNNHQLHHPHHQNINSTSVLDTKVSLPKLNVYDRNNKSCDTQLLSEDIKVVENDNNNNGNIIGCTSPTTICENKCTICLKVLQSSELLDVHMKSHAKPKFSCSQCEKQFSQLRNFKYHMSIHRGTREFSASCPECGKTFNDKGYLSSHLKIHRNKKEHVCSYCPKSFNQRVAFNMHVRIHLGLKPHCCTECGKTFSRKMLLKQHYRTHSGEKPFSCSFEGCEKRFADRSNMILHFRLHSGIKPFACNLCPKRFSKKHHLGTHLNYHLNLKPYKCMTEGCTMTFTQSSNMRTHMKKCPHRKVEN